MKKTITSAMLIAALTASAACAATQIRAVGSSTVYPFVTVAAEQFGRNSSFGSPVVESTGTGGGFKIFCAGAGEDTPSLANASRPIKASETELCAANGVKDITEVKIGYDGIVLANAVGSAKIDVTKEQLFKALARQVAKDGKLVNNPYKKWSDIDAALPANAIEVYGPPPTSGTRDAFAELVLEEACKDQAEFKAAYPDEGARKKACQVIREDGAYIEAGENDNLIVQKLKGNAKAFGIFGYSFLEENAAAIEGAKIAGVAPTFENISSGKYPVSRPLFVYVKNAHLKLVAGLKEFVSELVSTKAIGAEGYLVEAGLIPLHEDELKTVQAKVKGL